MASANIPRLVKHCTLAIHAKLHVADPKDRFKQAFTIARASLMKQGYLAGGSDIGPVSKIRLTGEGMKREALHSREHLGWGKSFMFDNLYRLIDIQDPPGKPQPKGVGKPLKAAGPKGQVMKQANRKLPFK